MMTDFEFKEKVTLGGGWSIEVWRGIIVIGHIRKNAVTSGYDYFHGRHNVLNPRLGDANLEELKRQVAARHAR
jgi:hypothetical protein